MLLGDPNIADSLYTCAFFYLIPIDNQSIGNKVARKSITVRNKE